MSSVIKDRSNILPLSDSWCFHGVELGDQFTVPACNVVQRLAPKGKEGKRLETALGIMGLTYMDVVWDLALKFSGKRPQSSEGIVSRIFEDDSMNASSDKTYLKQWIQCIQTSLVFEALVPVLVTMEHAPVPKVYTAPPSDAGRSAETDFFRYLHDALQESGLHMCANARFISATGKKKEIDLIIYDPNTRAVKMVCEVKVAGNNPLLRMFTDFPKLKGAFSSMQYESRKKGSFHVRDNKENRSLHLHVDRRTSCTYVLVDSSGRYHDGLLPDGEASRAEISILKTAVLQHLQMLLRHKTVYITNLNEHHLTLKVENGKKLNMFIRNQNICDFSCMLRGELPYFSVCIFKNYS